MAHQVDDWGNKPPEVELPALPNYPLRPSLYDTLPYPVVMHPVDMLSETVPPLGVGPNAEPYSISVETWGQYWPELPWWAWLLIAYAGYKVLK